MGSAAAQLDRRLGAQIAPDAARRKGRLVQADARRRAERLPAQGPPRGEQALAALSSPDPGHLPIGGRDLEIARVGLAGECSREPIARGSVSELEAFPFEHSGHRDIALESLPEVIEREPLSRARRPIQAIRSDRAQALGERPVLDEAADASESMATPVRVTVSRAASGKRHATATASSQFSSSRGIRAGKLLDVQPSGSGGT